MGPRASAEVPAGSSVVLDMEGPVVEAEAREDEPRPNPASPASRPASGQANSNRGCTSLTAVSPSEAASWATIRLENLCQRAIQRFLHPVRRPPPIEWKQTAAGLPVGRYHADLIPDPNYQVPSESVNGIHTPGRPPPVSTLIAAT